VKDLENTGLSQDILSRIQSCLAKNTKIEKVILYGSRAKGSYMAGSDIDLTLLGESLILDDVNQLEQAFDDLLLPYEIDLSIFDHIDNADLVDHINRVGMVIYNRS
jgi:predicted nucleotidyltransferase